MRFKVPPEICFSVDVVTDRNGALCGKLLSGLSGSAGAKNWDSELRFEFSGKIVSGKSTIILGEC